MAGYLLPLSLLASAAYSDDFVAQKSNRESLTGTSFGIPSTNATYDYVIIGGGTAGSVVASRLTQHSNAAVAMIEAGNFYEMSNGNWSQIPYWSKQWVGAAEDDWQPLIDCGLFPAAKVNGKNIHHAQGKNLGGSTGRNQTMYHRPTIGSYDAWAKWVGDDAYKWDNTLKYYQRSIQYIENAANRPANTTPPVSPGAYSDTGGPLIVSHAGYVHPLAKYGPAAFSSIGLKMINDFSGGNLDGYSYWPFTIDLATGLRSSAETSFLGGSLSRPKLTTFSKQYSLLQERYCYWSQRDQLWHAAIHTDCSEGSHCVCWCLPLTSIPDGIWNWTQRRPYRATTSPLSKTLLVWARTCGTLTTSEVQST